MKWTEMEIYRLILLIETINEVDRNENLVIDTNNINLIV